MLHLDGYVELLSANSFDGDNNASKEEIFKEKSLLFPKIPFESCQKWKKISSWKKSPPDYVKYFIVLLL